MNELDALPLTTPSAAVVLYGLLILSVIASAWMLRKRRQALAILAVLAVVCGALAYLIIGVIINPWPGEIESVNYALFAAVVFTVGAACVRWWAVVPALICILACVGITNVQFQMYPTAGDLTAPPASVSMSYEEFSHLKKAPVQDDQPAGALVTLPAHGAVSDFPARDAIAYVPPGYFMHPRTKLPVIVLMAGNPGQPDQWFNSGDADRAAADFAAQHHGLAPIVISVDATATFTGNPVCADGPNYKVMTYLTQDVPKLIKDSFRVNPDTQTWTIGGLSYGGTCSLQVITNHPEVYGHFLDFSGQIEPTLGNRADTVREIFGGNEAAFVATNPADLLKAHAHDGRYAHINGKFIAGEDDKEAVAALTTMNELTQAAGMDTTYESVPGGHTYQVWRAALAMTFDWAAQQGGVK
ncbi:alpha/beta hydrolase [Corynebacterium tapiri]|uniref:Esterase family protein n=1 Tax=Corynebacterium tapiri TaxID=1448266 RepID=A0A5C4U5T8_9CORY|nr:alpha/beta hydrolase-fold protein [Corynebacterium tapiri]TNL99756.1 esterase family protein [Corynebacterium tapiri]